MIFDFDDWQQEHDCRRELERLKEINPKFVVTLFAVPSKITLDMSVWYENHNEWVELAVHGWTHEPNTECENWTYEQCKEVITKSFIKHDFVKGFKAPGWQISDGCYKALLEEGFWVADQHYNDDRRPKKLPVYFVGENSYHGHTWDCGCNNGIYEDWENIVKKVKEADNFKFISEIIHETNVLQKVQPKD